MKQEYKRQFLRSLAAMGVAGLVSTPMRASATVALPFNLINVGPDRDFTTVQAALGAITDASNVNPYLILIDPGVYNIVDGAMPIELKSYVAVAGVERNSVVLVGEGNSNIRCASFSSLENVTIKYSGSGDRSGAIRSDVVNLRDFFLDNVHIDVSSSRPAIATHAYVDRMEIRNLIILTQSIGVDISAGGRIYIHDTNIHLYGASTSAHVGIRGNSNCRIFVFGGKIGSGYGYGEIVDPGHDVIGFLADTLFTGRIVIHGVWCICRNDGAQLGINVNCVRVNGANGWVRVFGSYFQAESPTGLEKAQTFSNPGNGRIELYGTRARNYGEGPIYSSNQIGLQYLTVNNHNMAYTNDSGGLVLLDASEGSFSIILPSQPCPTEQYIFKKVDSSLNTVTINGNGRLIDGTSSRLLVTQYEKLHLRFANNQYFIVG